MTQIQTHLSCSAPLSSMNSMLLSPVTSFSCMMRSRKKENEGLSRALGKALLLGGLVEQRSAVGGKAVGPLRRGREVLGGRRGWPWWEERAAGDETLARELGRWAQRGARVAKAVMACG